MPVTLSPQYQISVNDTEAVSVEFTDHLDSGELLTGTPTVVEVTTSDLTLANKALNTSTYTPSYASPGDAVVATSAAVQFTVTSSTAGTYRIRITVSTDATPARTFVRDILLDIV